MKDWRGFLRLLFLHLPPSLSRLVLYCTCHRSRGPHGPAGRRTSNTVDHRTGRSGGLLPRRPWAASDEVGARHSVARRSASSATTSGGSTATAVSIPSRPSCYCYCRSWAARCSGTCTASAGSTSSSIPPVSCACAAARSIPSPGTTSTTFASKFSAATATIDRGPDGAPIACLPAGRRANLSTLECRPRARATMASRSPSARPSPITIGSRRKCNGARS